MKITTLLNAKALWLLYLISRPWLNYTLSMKNSNLTLEIFWHQYTNQPIWVPKSECISVVPNESLFFFDKSSVPGWIMLRKYQLWHFSLFITHYNIFFCATLNEGQKVVSSLRKEVLKFLNFAKNRKIPTLKCIPRYIHKSYNEARAKLEFSAKFM